MQNLVWIGLGLACAIVLLGLVVVGVLAAKKRAPEVSAIYDGIEIAGARGWQRCDGGWFKTAGIIHVHTIEVDGSMYVDAMRIEEQ